jgi:hypothetical protein
MGIVENPNGPNMDEWIFYVMGVKETLWHWFKINMIKKP